jgi:hypothetical protein
MYISYKEHNDDIIHRMGIMIWYSGKHKKKIEFLDITDHMLL